MKKLSLVITALLLVTGLMAQVPDYFNYQAAVRNPDGTPMADQNVTIDLQLIRGEIDGPSIYLESHETLTDEFGMITLKVGDADFFSEIDWENGPYFLGISVNGVYHGASQLLSVPYALYARQAGKVKDGDSDPANELQNLSINELSRELSISDGNSVILPISPWKEIETDIYFVRNVGIGMYMQPQYPLDIQKNVYGDHDRALLRLKNIDEGNTAYVALALEAYGNLNARTFSRSEFLLTSDEYTEIPGFNGMTAIRAPGKGFSVLSESVNGSVRFYTTDVKDALFERMRIAPDGKVGIGTDSPESKIHVKGGDVFIEDFNRGVILTSPSGKHFRITVDDSGNLIRTEATL
ncbi:MAG: hypothetical protein V2B15_19260 [Bacteroidota bacterium]